METFAEPKEIVENPYYKEQRRKSLAAFGDVMIDATIIKIVNGFNKLSYCFTMQSCYGHFVYNGQENPFNLDPLPVTERVSMVEYRIAYIAFCVENSEPGKKLLKDLKKIAVIDPENIQFCSAEWFWERQVNSYALQVEPDRFKHQDKAMLDYKEALYIEKLRNNFFARLEESLQKKEGDWA